MPGMASSPVYVHRGQRSLRVTEMSIRSSVLRKGCRGCIATETAASEARLISQFRPGRYPSKVRQDHQQEDRPRVPVTALVGFPREHPRRWIGSGQDL